MKSILPKIFFVLVVAYAAFTHYLSYFNAKRLIYADFAHSKEAAGSGAYNPAKLDIDSIRYHGAQATIYFRFSGVYSNGSIKDFGERHYDAAKMEHEVTHGFLGWTNE